MNVGILALQGGYASHQAILKTLKCETTLVRKVDDFKSIDRLILPGGESTTMIKLLKRHHLWETLYQFSKTHPIFATCAGTILMASSATPKAEDQLKLVKIHTIRNYYGTQINSQICDIHVTLPKSKQSTTYSVAFIRAPRIQLIQNTNTHSNTNSNPNIKILATFQEDPVLIQQDQYLLASFHPEITACHDLHAYFLTL